ncbi:hypothetical protein B9G55_10965 [Saccharibacillus sp. O16]|nr:hypothetical protein B9G55_10965 [Saccharibacillus sp. O16]
MADEYFFAAKEIRFEDSWDPVSEADIHRSVPEEFPGKDFFMECYASHNGGYFSQGVFLWRDRFYEVAPEDENLLEVEAFNFLPLFEEDESPVLRSIPEVRDSRRRHWAAFDMTDFIETHLPFAGDAGDHDYWIDLREGTIKSVRWEEADGSLVPKVIVVAPEFRSFCTHLAADRTRP